MSKYGVTGYGFCYGIVKKAFLVELLENETLKVAERRTEFGLKEDYILEKLEV